MNMDTATNSIRNQIVYFNQTISQLDLLDPCPDVTRIIEEFIVFCCSTPMSLLTFEYLLGIDSVFKASCENLNHLLSHYEYHLEKYWAKQYTSDTHSILLENFPDIDDYRRSIQFEVNTLQKLGVQFTQNSMSNDESNSIVTKIAFIGSGPLPISSMLILNDYASSIDIYNIDKSEEANQLASLVSDRLLSAHLSPRMHFITHDMSQSIPFELDSILKQCQLIFVAALVGENESDKLNVLRSIVTESSVDTEVKTIQHIVIRTTDGLRQALYPKLSMKAITLLQSTINTDENNNPTSHFQLQSMIVHPQNDTRMSIIIIRKT